MRPPVRSVFGTRTECSHIGPFPHSYPLDDSAYPRFPLPASEQKYRDLDGDRMKVWVNEITAVSRKSRDDGNRLGTDRGNPVRPDDRAMDRWQVQRSAAAGCSG